MNKRYPAVGQTWRYSDTFYTIKEVGSIVHLNTRHDDAVLYESGGWDSIEILLNNKRYSLVSYIDMYDYLEKMLNETE